ncbi:trehalose-6-phosphate synthase (plasmid) [Haloterrigena salifodinae]|uniref:Trehalose-6-phosphate synthase n=1 Tax=Haloterrigena salifodinae TaxID=2675099 RepID=A0A8T8E792_9EURY|nr:trehalose-6-phosphate synthase [Haloterrigena salifodinae]QRV17579.1 trehalose-6-phosphate synthase [Haloterrigena salifodinae]
MRFTDARLPSTHPSNRQLRADGYGRSTADSRSDGSVCPGSLIVVSNRQPYRHEYDSEAEDSGGGGDRSTGTSSITVDEPTGGLTAGLDPVVQASEGTWIAWGDGEADFDVADDDGCIGVPPGDESYTLQRIDLSEEAVDSYYYGFSNRVLWPLCHGFVDLVENRSNDFEWYRTVNERFADAVAEHAEADSIIWVQDYHFGLAPRMIRESVPRSTTVAQFWHIPWPTPASFQHCPGGRAILQGLLGNDLLGFHIDRYVERFLDCVERYLPGADVDRTQRTVAYGGGTTRIVATPMGVDAPTHDGNARAVDSDQLSSLFDRYDISRENVIGLGVDRLDYSKGIPERLAAIERLLERNPGWHGEFTFLQTATPSRTDIDAYQRHGDLVRSEVMRINRRFGTDDWEPIVYTEDYLSNEELSGLYRRADLMVVSPLVDGMNLVAQEYVAASVDGDGSLVLSEGTGAHERLGSHALTIDPTDVDGFASQLEAAVTMAPRERQRRMNTLRNRVFDGDLEWWMETQFDWIRRVHADKRRDGGDRGSDSDPDPDRGPGSDAGSDTDAGRSTDRAGDSRSESRSSSDGDTNEPPSTV